MHHDGVTYIRYSLRLKSFIQKSDYWILFAFYCRRFINVRPFEKFVSWVVWVLL